MTIAEQLTVAWLTLEIATILFFHFVPSLTLGTQLTSVNIDIILKNFLFSILYRQQKNNYTVTLQLTQHIYVLLRIILELESK